MKLRLLLFICGLFGLLIFYLFSVQVKKERFKQINFDFTVRLQDKVPHRVEEIMEDAGFFVSPAISVVWVLGITAVGLFDVRKKKFHPGLLLIPLFFAIMVGVEIYGKDRVESPAPPFFMIKNPTTILPKYFVQEKYSYPSGHSARSLFLGVITALILSRYFKKIPYRLVFFAGAFGFTLLVSMGKIYLGHHWLSDIIGGWIISIVFLCFSLGFF